MSRSEAEDVHFEEAELLPGPTKGDCECGCGRFGRLKKANRAGIRCVRGCRCASCLGRNNRAKGQKKQRRAQRALGIQGTALGANHEELWRGVVRVEVKAGGQVAPAWRQYLKMEDQAESARAIGDTRPFIGVVMPDGVTDGVVMCRLSRLPAVVAALSEETSDEQRSDREDEGGHTYPGGHGDRALHHDP